MFQKSTRGFTATFSGGIFVAMLLGVTTLGLAAESPVQEIDFNRDIRPIFTKHCTACHGGVKQAADVSFVYGDKVVAPEGWVVEPGEPDDSLLMERVLSDDPDIRMPPPEHGPALNPQEVEVLRRWIQSGAKWSKHWSFEKPVDQPLPEVNDPTWPRQSLDYFVLRKLDAQELKPAEDARPERWLRRVTLDLTGLPPTLEERASFLKALQSCETGEQTDAAYAKVVDRLLASPAYGERWASVWLDQVRYADSKGLGLDGPRDVWKYRDWVIDAFNQDLPYDQFTIKQMAGDLLPNPTIEDFVATTAHRLTQTNEEGGTDDEEFRVAAVLDRTNTTWQTWQGVTFGCAQCHSHPYDPIEHDEYYQFAAFFNNTADSDLGQEWPTVQVPYEKSDYEKAGQLDQKITQFKHDIWDIEYRPLQDSEHWQPLIDLTAKTNNKTNVAIEKKSDHEEFHTTNTVSKGTSITITATVPSTVGELTAIRFTGMPLNPESALQDSEWGFVLSHLSAKWIDSGKEEAEPIEFSHVIADEPEPFFNPLETLNSKSGQGFATYTRIYRPRSAALVLKSPVMVPEGGRIEITLVHRDSALGTFPLVTKRGHLAATSSTAFAKLAEDSTLNDLKDQLAKLVAERKEIKSTSIPVLKERPDHLERSQHVFIRGLFLTKDKEVSPDTPESFGALSETQADRVDRLALAKWMVSSENPLTARVAVNRLWARLFGFGIVATEEDFGSSGELPSHPALLDHLALKFQNDYQWSQKKLLKSLVLSSTYRQSSVIRPEINEYDPNNRLLARGPRNRLSSEIVRDQALAISGLLSSKMYGKPVRPPIPDGVWKPFAGWDKWQTPGTDSEDRYRRAVYTYMKRSIPYPMFAAFDAPSREVCTPRRLNSNTPIQALMNLNDQTMIECAKALSERLQAIEGDDRTRIEQGFTLATCRSPEADETNALLELLGSYGEESKAAGWEAVASVLLNLDELVTK